MRGESAGTHLILERDGVVLLADEVGGRDLLVRLVLKDLVGEDAVMYLEGVWQGRVRWSG